MTQPSEVQGRANMSHFTLRNYQMMQAVSPSHGMQCLWRTELSAQEQQAIETHAAIRAYNMRFGTGSKACQS
jgi:putative component of membrane protein insertase Oxa1/YidC/SpoIIIJ protein YidD